MAVTAEPVEEAARAALAGQLIVMPTDTVYGIGTRPDDPAATARLFDAKGRPRDLELPVLVPSVSTARDIAMLDASAERVAAACWPGAVTLILARAAIARDWDLGGDSATIGVRIPRHSLAQAVLAITGPMAVTSANRSGQAPITTCDALLETFGDTVAVLLCQEEPLEGSPSTVVDLSHGEPRVLREGGVAAETIARSLAGDDPLLDSPLSP